MKALSILVERELRGKRVLICKEYIVSVIVFFIIAFVTKSGVLITSDSSRTFVFCYSMASIYIGISNTLSLFQEEKSYIMHQFYESFL